MTKIVCAPHDALFKKAKKIDLKKDKKMLPILLSQMENALLSASDPKGVGLAAPQIGKSYSIFMAKPTEKSPISVYINPEILEIDKIKTKTNKKEARKLEGCLSLPNIWGVVFRAPTVKLSYYDETGKHFEKKFKGFMATIAQHEIDHLNGTLFTKRVVEQNGQLYKSYKNEKGEDEFEEFSI